MKDWSTNLFYYKQLWILSGDEYDLQIDYENETTYIFKESFTLRNKPECNSVLSSNETSSTELEENLSFLTINSVIISVLVIRKLKQKF